VAGLCRKLDQGELPVSLHGYSRAVVDRMRILRVPVSALANGQALDASCPLTRLRRPRPFVAAQTRTQAAVVALSAHPRVPESTIAISPDPSGN
jgi:hypothetical protein